MKGNFLRRVDPNKILKERKFRRMVKIFWERYNVKGEDLRKERTDSEEV